MAITETGHITVFYSHVFHRHIVEKACRLVHHGGDPINRNTNTIPKVFDSGSKAPTAGQNVIQSAQHLLQSPLFCLGGFQTEHSQAVFIVRKFFA